MAKIKYTKLFEQFWKAYPRRTAKLPAFKAWEKHVDESDAFQPKQIIGDIEKRTRLKYWPMDMTKVPHAATWINQARWEDEGWENEIKTRGQEHGVISSTRALASTYVDDAPDLSGWQMMLNRLMRNYIMHTGGMPDALLQRAIKIKNEVLRECESEAERDTAADKSTRPEWAHTMVTLMLDRFDKDLGYNYSVRVYAGALKGRQDERR